MDLDNMMNILVCDDNGDYYYYSSDDDDDDDNWSTTSSSGSFSKEADQYLSRLKDVWINEEGEEEEEENYINDVNDLEYEILTRVDNFDTLLYGCRWVCKDWQRLMYETNFKQLHSQRSPTISGYYIQNDTQEGYFRTFISHPKQMEDYEQLHEVVVLEHIVVIEKEEEEEEEEVEIVSAYLKESKEIYVFPSLGFMPKNVRIVSSPPHGIGGLLLCHNIRTNERDEPILYSGSSYCVCKPTTLEWAMIPPRPLKEKYYLKREEIVVKPRLDPTTDPLHYQIILFSCQDRSYRRRRSCIHTFDSSSWAWKEFEDLNFPPLDFTSQSSGVLVNGALHWLRYTRQDRVLASVFRYSTVIEQSWSTIPLPQEQIQTDKLSKSSYAYYLDSKLVDYQGKVGLLCMNMKWIQLWVLLNHPHDHQSTTATWKKIYLIDMEPLSLSRSELMDLYTSDVIVMLCDKNVKWYNFKTKTCATKKLPKKKLRLYALPRDKKWFALQSDFIPCNWQQH